MVLSTFFVLAGASLTYALFFGGASGRWAFLILFVGIASTRFAQELNPSWTAFNPAVAAVDTLTLMALVALMLRSKRYWPIWMVASQFLSVASHAGAALAKNVNGMSYNGLSAMWVIPLLLSMVIGIRLDRQSDRIRRG